MIRVFCLFVFSSSSSSSSAFIEILDDTPAGIKISPGRAGIFRYAGMHSAPKCFQIHNHGGKLYFFVCFVFVLVLVVVACVCCGGE